jgi:hypothetical protein
LEVKLAGMLSLNPEDQKILHPEALKWFNDRRAEIQREVPLEELSHDDLNTFLLDDEKRELQSCIKEITKGLAACMAIGGEDSSDPMTNATVGLTVLEFEVNSLTAFNSIKWLLKKAYHRKMEAERGRKEEEKQRAEEAREGQRRREEAAEAERREKEKEKRWRATYMAIDPPMDDAEKYLNDEEYEKFEQATWKAIDVYLKIGEDYLKDSQTLDYRHWLWVINYRKEDKRQQIAANLAAREYDQRLNDERARLKALLFSSEKDTASYFKNHAKDARYTGESFSQFLDSEEIGAFDKKIEDTGRSRLAKLVSNDFQESFYAKYYRSFFLLPSAEYSLEGVVPCLDFMFEVFAVVETRVWFKSESKNFGLKEPDFLGYDYFLLRPEDLGGYSFWQVIPLVLLRGLLNGETKPNGTIISAASDDSTTYKIPKFKEEVDIPDKFADYLKNIGSFDGMVNMGIVIEKVASVAKSELGKLKVEHEASPLENRIKRKGTKKAWALQLFSEGKGPSSPEVKALDIHKSTRFKYYKEYLAH